jgi:hypothetical protein
MTFHGRRYLVWDTRLLEVLHTITKIIVCSSRFSDYDADRCGQALCLEYVADRLFDEGLPVDAWMISVGARTTLEGNSIDDIEVPDVDAEVVDFVQTVQGDFLFFHELGHLLAEEDHQTYRNARAVVDKSWPSTAREWSPMVQH